LNYRSESWASWFGVGLYGFPYVKLNHTTMNKRISTAKLKVLFMLRESGNGIRATARFLRISRTTVKSYLNDMDSFSRQESREKATFSAYLKKINERPDRTCALYPLFPDIILRIETQGSTRKIEWEEYKRLNPKGYSYSFFTEKLVEYCKRNEIRIRQSNIIRVKNISQSDMTTLKKWKRSGMKWKWERATVLFDSFDGKCVETLAKKVERGRRKVKSWIRLYESEGLDALLRKKSRVNETKLAVIKRKKENLIKLLHEPPKLHQVNRASWSLETLCYAYGKKYGTSISMTQASTYIRAEGFRFVKARKVLTSPDPQYREKLSVITGILSRLGPKEKFFSVDEFGPFSVRIQGGRSYVKKGETKTFPQRQFSKGRLICTAALELSENQMIHFYSEKKDTEEMIRLVDLLIKQYHNQEKIYFSWDAASWHASKKLYQRIEEINLEASKGKKGPLVELAPLPASAQFLNVIESVFSGLAKAIIHNSNYDSVEECKRAIDKYFDDRNNYFRQNPKRAGNKIWGNEKHASNFDESKNFKDVK
jgi:transposase